MTGAFSNFSTGLLIESHSIGFHLFSTVYDYTGFFIYYSPYLIGLFFGIATVGFAVAGFTYHKNRI